MDQTLDQLATFVASTQHTDLPEPVVDRASAILVDTLGCLVGGSDCRAAHIGDRLTVPALTHVPAGVVVGRPGAYPPDLAAFVNTSMIRYLDFNDHLVAGHASDMTGGLLALVGLRPTSGRDLLTALVVAYEVHARVARTMNDNQTIDRTYAITIGAAAGACNLLGLDLDQTRHALSMATNSGVCLRAARAGALSDYKGVASAVGVKLAVFATLLAREGLTGPSAPFEGRHGLSELLTGEAGPVAIQPFGDWQTLLTCMKYWPVAYGMQPAVWAALQLREQMPARRVREVVLHAAPFAWFESGSEAAKWDPHTRESADHSLPYAFAHTLRHGTLDHDAFEPAAFRDPQTLGLMEGIRVEPDWDRGPKISDVVGVRAEAIDEDGTQVVVNVNEPRGHHRNPMTTEDITDKARRLLEPFLGDRTDAILEVAWQVRSLDILDPLLDALVTRGSPPVRELA